MSAEPIVVDADGHVLEPPDGMLRYTPEGWRERVWHVETKADGSEWLHFNGGIRPAGGMALAGTAGMSSSDRERARKGQMRYADVRPGAFAPAARLPDMQVEGIHQAVLYPTMMLGLPGLEDAEFAEVQANAYNEWLASYCGYAPTRLFGAAVIPMQDSARAVRTIRRAKQLGLVGVFLRPNPTLAGKKLNDPVYDPVWRACEELQMPIGLHPFLSPDLPGACRALGYAQLHADGVDYAPKQANPADPIRNLSNIFFSQALSNPFDVMECVALFCAGGICERFPKLTVLFLEANGGWIVPLLERLDHHFAIFRWDVPWLRMRPSEYFRRQCYISFDPDETTLAFTANHPLVGAERIIWASDYPHPDAKFPGVVRELHEATESLTDAQRAHIFGDNAREVYHLPAPPPH